MRRSKYWGMHPFRFRKEIWYLIILFISIFPTGPIYNGFVVIFQLVDYTLTPEGFFYFGLGFIAFWMFVDSRFLEKTPRHIERWWACRTFARKNKKFLTKDMIGYKAVDIIKNMENDYNESYFILLAYQGDEFILINKEAPYFNVERLKTEFQKASKKETYLLEEDEFLDIVLEYPHTIKELAAARL